MVDAAVGGKTGINTGAGQEPGRRRSTSRPECSATSTCSPRCPRPSCGPGWARWSSAASSPTRRSCGSSSDAPACSSPGSPVLRELVERAVRVKADVVAGDLQRDRRQRRAPRSRGAQLRPHHGSRRRAGERLRPAARRGGRDRLRVRRRAGPRGRRAGRRGRRPAPRRRSPGSGCRPAGPARRTTTCERGWRSTRSRGARPCGSSCSTAWPSPRILADPDEDHLRAAYDVMVGGAR